MSRYPASYLKVVANLVWICAAGQAGVLHASTAAGWAIQWGYAIQMYRPNARINAKTSFVSVTNAILAFGIKGGSPSGIVFSNTLSVPPNFSGTSEWIQICHESQLIFEDTLYVYTAVQARPGPYLDTSEPYNARLPGTDIPDDTPSSPLPSPFIRHERVDSFTMYMMFKPDVGQPVPLRAVDWYWSGGATNGPGGWSLSSDPSDHTTDPGDYDQRNYRVWNSNIRSRHREPYNPFLPGL